MTNQNQKWMNENGNQVTLEELKKEYPEASVWGDEYLLQREWHVGQVGRYRSGQKVHWLSCDRVVGITVESWEEMKRQTYGRQFRLNVERARQMTERKGPLGEVKPSPVYFSVHGYCNGNGQHVGRVLEGQHEVTCKKCQKGQEEWKKWQAEKAEAEQAEKAEAEAEVEMNENVKNLNTDPQVNEEFEMFVNQGWREAWVLARLGDEILVEYIMPAGSTAMLVLDANSFQTVRNCSYKTCPKKWLKAMQAEDVTWDGNSQCGMWAIPFPDEYKKTLEERAQELPEVEEEAVNEQNQNVIVTSLTTGKSYTRTLASLKEICTGNDYQEMLDDLHESGVSESSRHRVEMAPHLPEGPDRTERQKRDDKISQLEKELARLEKDQRDDDMMTMAGDCGISQRSKMLGLAQDQAREELDALLLVNWHEDHQAISDQVKALAALLNYRLTFGYIGNCSNTTDDRSWHIMAPHNEVGTWSDRLGGVATEDLVKIREALESGEAEKWARKHQAEFIKKHGDSPTILTLEMAEAALIPWLLDYEVLPGGPAWKSRQKGISEDTGADVIHKEWPNTSWGDAWPLASSIITRWQKGEFVYQEEASSPQAEELPQGDDIPAPQPTEADLAYAMKELRAAEDDARTAWDTNNKNAEDLQAAEDKLEEVQALADRLAADIDEAAAKALDSLARYKFQMFGYWAGIWVHLNRIEGKKRPSPFGNLVKLARQIEETNGGK